jgi:hypothetical protein
MFVVEDAEVFGSLGSKQNCAGPIAEQDAVVVVLKVDDTGHHVGPNDYHLL